MMWAWGLISPQILQKLMFLFIHDIENAKNEDLDMNMIKNLTALGSHGDYSQNMHRSLMNSIGKHNLPTPHSFLAPLTHKVIGDFSRAVDMILPHELFASVYHCYKAAWVDRICPSSARVEKFWDAVNGTVQFLSSSLFPSIVMEPPMVGIGKAWGRVHTKYEHSWLPLSKLIVYTKPYVPANNVK